MADGNVRMSDLTATERGKAAKELQAAGHFEIYGNGNTRFMEIKEKNQ